VCPPTSNRHDQWTTLLRGLIGRVGLPQTGHRMSASRWCAAALTRPSIGIRMPPDYRGNDHFACRSLVVVVSQLNRRHRPLASILRSARRFRGPFPRCGLRTVGPLVSHEWAVGRLHQKSRRNFHSTRRARYPQGEFVKMYPSRI